MRHITRILLNACDDIKYSPRAIILLIGLQNMDMKQLDEHLAKVGGVWVGLIIIILLYCCKCVCP